MHFHTLPIFFIILQLGVVLAEHEPNVGFEVDEDIGALQTDLDTLQKSVDNQFRDLQAKLRDSPNDQKLLNEFKLKMEEIKDILIPNNLQTFLDECVADIKSRRFPAAAEKMGRLNSSNDISYIVNTVYDHRPGNFELVLETGTASDKRETKIWIWSALLLAITSSTKSDPFMLLKLKEDVDLSPISTSATQLKQEIQTHLRPTLKESFKDSLLNSDTPDSQTKKLSEVIYESDSVLFNSLIKEIVAEIYKDKFSGRNAINYEDWEFELMRDVNYLYPNTLGSRWTKGFTGVPALVIAIALKLPVCIKINSQTLHADYGSPGRTWVHAKPSQSTLNHKWTFDKDGNFYWIWNVDRQEYMYMSSSWRRHFVYTWGYGKEDIQEDGKWIIRRGDTDRTFKIVNNYYGFSICYNRFYGFETNVAYCPSKWKDLDREIDIECH